MNAENSHQTGTDEQFTRCATCGHEFWTVVEWTIWKPTRPQVHASPQVKTQVLRVIKPASPSLSPDECIWCATSHLSSPLPGNIA